MQSKKKQKLTNGDDPLDQAMVDDLQGQVAKAFDEVCVAISSSSTGVVGHVEQTVDHMRSVGASLEKKADVSTPPPAARSRLSLVSDDSGSPAIVGAKIVTPPSVRKGKELVRPVKQPKTTTGVTGSSGANDASLAKSRGRPQKDAATMLRGVLLQLSTAHEGVRKFFGEEWKNVRRNWDNYIKGLAGLIEFEEDVSQLLEYEKLHKQASSARKILNIVNSKGLASDATRQVYEQELIWCKQSPKVDNPMSLSFSKLMLGNIAAAAWPAPHFWARICDEQIKELALEIADGVQTSFVVEKVIVIQNEAATVLEARGKLQELVLAYTQAHLEKHLVADLLHVQMTFLRNVVYSPSQPDDMPMQERLKLLGDQFTKVNEFPVGKALQSSQKGRQILTDAGKCLDRENARLAEKDTCAHELAMAFNPDVDSKLRFDAFVKVFSLFFVLC